MESSRFTSLNEGFICERCGFEVGADISGSCRNHCTECLHSLHVDQFPGDRLNQCCGLMVPVFIQAKSDRFVIYHRCLVCGELKLNKSAPDDNYESILKIISQSSEGPEVIVEAQKKNSLSNPRARSKRSVTRNKKKH